MSKTYCRFCKLHFVGLYMNCPKCGRWLAPQDVAPGEDITPDQEEEYEVIDD